jgi:hypothetical protein
MVSPRGSTDRALPVSPAGKSPSVDGTISQDVTPRDVVAFGAMLAQPRQPDPEWDATCRRLLATYLNGLRTC